LFVLANIIAIAIAENNEQFQDFLVSIHPYLETLKIQLMPWNLMKNGRKIIKKNLKTWMVLQMSSLTIINSRLKNQLKPATSGAEVPVI